MTWKVEMDWRICVPSLLLRTDENDVCSVYYFNRINGNDATEVDVNVTDTYRISVLATRRMGTPYGWIFIAHHQQLIHRTSIHTEWETYDAEEITPRII